MWSNVVLVAMSGIEQRDVPNFLRSLARFLVVSSWHYKFPGDGVQVDALVAFTAVYGDHSPSNASPEFVTRFLSNPLPYVLKVLTWRPRKKSGCLLHVIKHGEKFAGWHDFRACYDTEGEAADAHLMYRRQKNFEEFLKAQLESCGPFVPDPDAVIRSRKTGCFQGVTKSGKGRWRTKCVECEAHLGYCCDEKAAAQKYLDHVAACHPKCLVRSAPPPLWPEHALFVRRRGGRDEFVGVAQRKTKRKRKNGDEGEEETIRFISRCDDCNKLRLGSFRTRHEAASVYLQHRIDVHGHICCVKPLFPERRRAITDKADKCGLETAGAEMISSL